MALGITNLYIPARIYRWLDNIDIPETVLRNSAIGFLMLTNVININPNDWHPVIQNDLLDPIETLIKEYNSCYVNNSNPLRGFCRSDEVWDIDCAAKISNHLLKDSNCFNLLAAEARASSSFIL